MKILRILFLSKCLNLFGLKPGVSVQILFWDAVFRIVVFSRSQIDCFLSVRPFKVFCSNISLNYFSQDKFIKAEVQKWTSCLWQECRESTEQWKIITIIPTFLVYCVIADVYSTVFDTDFTGLINHGLSWFSLHSLATASVSCLCTLFHFPFFTLEKRTSRGKHNPSELSHLNTSETQ